MALGVKLERLYRIWQQLFIRYYASESDVVACSTAAPGRGPACCRRHSIVYFRDREEYNRPLRPTVPNIGISAGVYAGPDAAGVLLRRQGGDDRTLYHEATHQLFHESRPVSPEVVRKENFWIIEGIAMFMESLRREDGYCVLGGFDDERMHAARYRLLHDKFYVPLDELISYGMEKLQNDPRIGTLYSQAAGLTHFLVFYDGGRYRDALVSYLAAVYSGRDDHDTLAKLTGQDYGELDKQYRGFIEGEK